MSAAEKTQLSHEAVTEMRERWVNDVLGSIGCIGLFVVNVSMNSNSDSEFNIGASGLCLIAAANFAGGAFDRGGKLAKQRQLQADV